MHVLLSATMVATLAAVVHGQAGPTSGDLTCGSTVTGDTRGAVNAVGSNSGEHHYSVHVTTVQWLRHHFGPFSTRFPAPCHPMHAVLYALGNAAILPLRYPHQTRLVLAIRYYPQFPTSGHHLHVFDLHGIRVRYPAPSVLRKPPYWHRDCKRRRRMVGIETSKTSRSFKKRVSPYCASAAYAMVL